MKTVIDGYEFKLYLEGIQVPFIGANIEYSGMTSVASIELFPAKEFEKLTSNLSTLIFFKQLGVDEEFKLLFIGSTSGKQFSLQGPDRSYKLIAYGRSHKFNSILIASFMAYDGEASNFTATASPGASGLSIQSATGTGSLQRTAKVDETSPDINAGTSVYAKDFGTGEAGQSAVTEETNAAVAPNAKISKSLTEGAGKNAIKNTLDKIIYDACHSASVIDAIDYDTRMHLDKFINELPATWAQYIINANASENMRKVITNYLDSVLAGTSSLMTLINNILNIFMAEAWEIPGVAINSLLITPDYLASDIPTCNMILPSEKNSVNFSDLDGNRITRILTFAGPTQQPGDIPDQGSNASGVSNKTLAKTNISMYPNCFESKEVKAVNLKTAMQKLQTVTVEHEEYIGSRTKPVGMPPDYGIFGTNPVVHADLTEHLFYKMRDGHRSLNISTKFMPGLIPGQKAILFDTHMPLIFKIIGLSFNITPGGLSTNINAANVEYLSSAIFRHPIWYNNSYKPENIHEIYKGYFGCSSMSEAAGLTGKILEAYTYTYDKYKLSEIKSYLANKITQRHFDTESDVFKLYNASNQQAQDAKGVLIYVSQVFDDYFISGYSLDMKEKQLVSHRQQPVLDYVKTIYGIIGDTHE